MGNKNQEKSARGDTKIATENRQNRHLAEFQKSLLLKVVEHQILSGKVVSQA